MSYFGRIFFYFRIVRPKPESKFIRKKLHRTTYWILFELDIWGTKHAFFCSLIMKNKCFWSGVFIALTTVCALCASAY